ncbi:hypothetical protein ACHQM5_002349 [Ranunculus cassubicifolius]
MAIIWFFSSSKQPNHIQRSRKNRLSKRCLTMAKQQKTRFYIFGRCISMLLCWRAHALAD